MGALGLNGSQRKQDRIHANFSTVLCLTVRCYGNAYRKTACFTLQCQFSFDNQAEVSVK
jgi:hypothetical protein